LALRKEKAMRRIRQLIAITCCFIAAPILIYRSVTGLPSESELTKVEGIVTEVLMVKRSNKYEQTTHPAIAISGYDELFLYLDWFPRPEALTQELRQGDHIVVLSDTGENNWLWQVQKDGNLIVEYADIRKAVASNNRLDPLLGGGLLIAGCFGVYRLIRKGRSSNTST
jgi:hypothetical protein